MMVNFNCEVISFDFALEEALKCLLEFKMSRALKIGTQRSNFYTDFWK